VTHRFFLMVVIVCGSWQAAAVAQSTQGVGHRTEAATVAPTPVEAESPDSTKPAPKDGAKPQGGSKPEGSEKAAAPTAAETVQEERDDAVLDRAEPDFTVITLPTTLRMPKYRSAFRVTHRFARPLGQGSFGDLVEDFFGFDASAVIGLELRFGIFPGAQIGIHRTSDKTIEFFGAYDLVSQGDSFPLGLAAFGSIEGTDNFKDSYSPALGLVVSRKIGTRAAVYAEPFWVNNTNPLPSEVTLDDNDTFYIGLGTRVRVLSDTYVVAEFIPRVAGFDPGVHGGNFGIEKRVGGHSFQVNFSNFLGTTMGQIARGGARNEDWYIGFNITRKFF
jgi:hypothetical protein